MKVPKRLLQALNRREKAVFALTKSDEAVSSFLDKHGIAVENYDINLGVEELGNPSCSKQRILAAIEKFEECKK